MNEKTNAGKPIESLQHMLRVLSQEDGRLVPVTPDGIFGQNTAAAVTAYQRSRGLPATGEADMNTWESVVREYEACRAHHEPSEALRVLLEPMQTIKPGEKNSHVRLIQSMLLGCGEGYHCLPGMEVTGVMDAPTVAAVRKFQTICGLQPTGSVNRVTWKHLARLYPSAVGDGSNSQK